MQSRIGREHPKSARGRQRSGLDIDGLGAQALAFLASDPNRLGDFLASTGLSVPNLRQAAAEPGFTRGVLAYLAANETLVIDFAADLKLDPAWLGAAIQALDRPDADDARQTSSPES